MSQKSSITTRSKLRRLAEEQSARRREEIVSDSGMHSERVPGSPSVAPTMASTSALNIPLTGGRVIDYSARSTSEGPLGGQAPGRGRHTSPRSRASSKNSRKSVEHIKKRIEYEAERELVQLKENLLKKRMEADIAEIEAAAESDDSASDVGTAQRVEQWIDTTPQAGNKETVRVSSPVLCDKDAVPSDKDAVLCTPSVGRGPIEAAAPRNIAGNRHNVSTLTDYRNNIVSHVLGTPVSGPFSNVTVPMSQARTPVGERVSFRLPATYPVTTTPAAGAPSGSTRESDARRTTYGADERESRRGASGDRDSKIDRLADAITSMARPRPVPRQAYELPNFNGDPADWISYKNMYWDTTEMYNFRPFENLARLKTSLHGEAKISVEDLLRSGTDPNEIMRALEEEYGHPTLILQGALKKIRELPRVTENGRELRKFASTVRNVVSLFKNIRADGYLNNPQIVSEILQKLTSIQRAQYGDFAMGLESAQGVDLRVSPDLHIISQFLNHLTRATSYYVQASMFEPGPSKPPVRQQKAVARPFNSRAPPAQKVNIQSDESMVPAECVVCNKEHAIENCDTFGKLSVQDRWATIKAKNTCFKCLIRKHPKRFCRAKRCDKCGYSHHSLLHADKASGSNNSSKPVKEKTESVTNIGEWRATALLKIVPVTITDDKQIESNCYALLDDGATVSLIDSSIAANLEGPRIPLTLKTAGGYGVSDLTSKAVEVSIRGPNGLQHKIKCRTMYNMNLPTQTVSAAMLSDNAHLRDLGCVEMTGAKPLLLLGQDNWQLLVSQDIRQGRSGKPVASLTKLGWVVHGPFDNSNNDNGEQSINCMAVSLPDLHDLVKAQFELEAIGISQNARKHKNNERALKVLDDTSKRVSNGSQWEVGLLWKHDQVELPDNYHQARQRLHGIERRMRKDAGYAEAYSKQIDRLLEEGYARKLEGEVDQTPIWYLPHFGVVNPNKPGKLRLVFDAAAASHGTCLNDNLLTGPDLLNSLPGILIRFRIGPIGFTGDIADMFMRIRIRAEDQGAQLFLWRGADQTREPSVFAMNSMIFGATSSPTTAIYILNKNASEFEDKFPEAVEAIKTKHYMDDYLDSAWTEQQANKLIEEVTHIHASGGFNIRGWVTNSSELMNKLKVDMPEKVALEKGLGIMERTLGLIWAPREDELGFDLSFKRLPEEIKNGSIVPTKRQFLSFIMSIYDPLGFLYPCVIQSRILMQAIWKSGIQWDEPLKDKEAKVWFAWLNNLEKLNEVKIPRWYGLNLIDLELHVFGDASELAYAAVAYLVGYDAIGNREVVMLAGKARVAPQKVVSIPRLELQAALLACRLANTVETELGLPIKLKTYWTDSKTVLKWINSDAQEFQRFVSHRLAEIDKLSDRGNWRWVPSEENSADVATRLSWPDNHAAWLRGPLFLRDPQERWPVCREAEAAEADLERIQRVHATAEPAAPLLQYERYSSWVRVKRVMIRVLIFIGLCRKRRSSPEIQRRDHEEAHGHLMRLCQEDSFKGERAAILKGLPVPKDSSIKALDPMITDDGLLRVRGRLSACEVLSFDERHPIILDGRHPLTRKLIAFYHGTALHANHETVVNNLREKYWVIKARTSVKTVVSNCQLCKNCRAKPSPPKMGDLPLARVTTSRRAFVRVGVDYFGPMEVSIGRRREKRWGALFTCLTTRAVHLELAASLSADSAILALRRLIARRGQPAHMYSDQGTNFIGANSELRAALKDLNQGQVRAEAINRGIEWHFNPPAAPHMGGCWERLVRSVKNALRSTLKERAPREEVLYTLLAEAELIINSRPLSYVHDDHDQPMVLTPNHLLLGTASGSTPFAPADSEDVDSRRQWRRVSALADMFWRRWLREYLPTLQRREKWANNVPNVRVGDVVVIADNNKERSAWTKGVIKAVYAGNDGIIRVVDVKTLSGVLRRPVAKIVVLPTDQDVMRWNPVTGGGMLGKHDDTI